MKNLFYFLILVFTSVNAMAQKGTRLEGVVLDKRSGNPIPYATVGIQGTSSGSISNDLGEFAILLTSNSDTLIVNNLGYEETSIILNESISPLKIYLKETVYDLNEVIVLSKSPQDYILEAALNYEENIKNEPYSIRSYLCSSSSIDDDENKKIVKDEAVFISYISELNEELKENQTNSELILYRHSNNEVDIDVGSVINIKKLSRKIEKMNTRQEKRGEKTDVTTDSTDLETQIDSVYSITNSNPEELFLLIQKLTDLPFFQKKYFEKFEFSFAPSSTFYNREQIVISFKSKKAVDFIKYNGKLYLDKDNLAISAVDYDSVTRIPKILKPLIKWMTSINIKEISEKTSIHNQLAENGNWYPKKIKIVDKTVLKNGKLFAKNQFLTSYQTEVLNVDKIFFDSKNPINAENYFDPSNKYENQIKLKPNISWDNINILQE